MRGPDGFAAVVARHWKDTAGYLVTGREPCISIAKAEVRHVRRRLKQVAHADLGDVDPPASWFMAVLVCAGDDLAPLAAWAKGREVGRIHFYLHAEAKALQLAPWRDAGFPLDRVDEGFTSWTTLHRRLGFDLNARVYEDHRGA